MDLEQIIRENKGTILDVRTPEEFMGGHVSGSVNIPLQELNLKMDEVRRMEQPLILCCASGGRSGVAADFLNRLGIACINAGSWLNVNYYKNNAV